MNSTAKCDVAIVAALGREIADLIKHSSMVRREHQGRSFQFFGRNDTVAVCAGTGSEAARRATEAAIALYQPALVQSVGFAGALESGMRVGDIFVPGLLIDARDGSRTKIAEGNGTLVTFMSVADASQKGRLARAYAAQAVDMEAAGVAAAAHAHGIAFRAVKVISDRMNFEMPDMSHFIDAQGRIRTISLAAYAALRPWLWPRIATLAHNSRKAAAALERYLRDHRPANANHIAEAKTR
jgi:adenosylhomocysteine nucleosidase